MARNSNISGGVNLHKNLYKIPGVTCFQKSSFTNEGLEGNEREDVMIIEDVTETQNTSVGAPLRGNVSVLQIKKETLEVANEDLIKRKCSDDDDDDDDISVIRHIVAPPRMLPSAAEGTKCEVRKLYQQRYKKQCTETSECSSKQSNVGNSLTRLPSLSSCSGATADVVLPIQSKGQCRCKDTGISSIISHNTVLSSNTTLLSAQDAVISTRNEISKTGNKRKVVLNRVRAHTNTETVVEDSNSALKNTTSCTTVCATEVFPLASPYKSSKSSLSPAVCEVSESKIISTENKKTDTSVTNKILVPVTADPGLVAVFSSEAFEVQVKGESFKNFTVSKTSYVRRQRAFSPGHKIAPSEAVTLQEENSNKPVIPAQMDSGFKRQFGLSSEHSLVSPSQMCSSVIPCSSTLERGKTPSSEVPTPPGPKVESVVNKLHDYVGVLCSDTEGKQNEPSHYSSNRRQDTDFISASTNILVQNKKVVSETGHDQYFSISVACKESTSTVSKQIAVGSPLCSNGESKGIEFGVPPEVKGRNESDCTARNRSVSVLHNLRVPASLSGNSVFCVTNTSTTQKENSPFLCSTAGKHYMEPAVNARKQGMTQPQSSTNSSISVASKKSTNTKCEQVSCGASLSSSVEDRKICLLPGSKQTKLSGCTERKSIESVLRKLEIPVSSCGSSVACVGSTENMYKEGSTVLSNTAGEDSVEPAIMCSEFDIAKPQSQNLKLSREISRHPRKYSVIKNNSLEILMPGQKTPEKKSPSKKLSRNSPINYVRKNRSPYKQMYGSTSANRGLKFDCYDSDTKSGLFAVTQSKNQSLVHEIFFKKEYVSYFEFIIAEVMKDKDMLSVLSEEDVDAVTSFGKLEGQVKELYIRMLSRKYSWHRVSDIKYDDINVPAAFTELEISGLITSDYSSEELAVLLNMLKMTELRLLCQNFRIPSAAEPKQKRIQALLRYGRSQQTITGNQGCDSRAIIKCRLTEALGHCVKLCAKGRESFRRIVLLFSLPHQDAQEDRETSKQLILLHYVKTRRVEFPTYVILKTRPIFSSRDDLMRFEEASQLLTDLLYALSTKQWVTVMVYGKVAQEQFSLLVDNCALNDWLKSLPLFIRRYSAGSVYAYAMTKSLEAYKKHKDQLPKCENILQELLSQDVYLPHYRGRWYEELALILQVHLKKYEQAAATVIEAMKDDHVSEVHQVILSGRCSLLLRKKALGENLRSKLRESVKDPLKVPPSVTIKAKSLQINVAGHKQVYVQENTCKQEIIYSSVEECAISHYKSQGYTEGVHDEGGTIKSLFGLIFWDVIYEHPVPDVFLSSYQREPLDLCSGEFYRNRKEIIDERLESLCKWDMKYVQDYMEKIFKENEGKESIVIWERFQNLQQILGLIKCIGVQVLSRILERLVKNHRTVRNGFPDLLVWNPDSSKYKFVEVKGPGDRLSVPQSMWFDYLLKCNANAEVCHVQTTGATKQKLKTKVVPDEEKD